MGHGPMRVVVKIDHPAMRAAVGGITERGLMKAGEIARQRASNNSLSRYDTGALSRSFRVVKQPGGTMRWSVVVGTPLPYAKYQEFGTRAHGPVRAKFLRFKPKGSNKFVFAKWVRGVTPAKFMQKTLDQVRPSDFL